MTSGESTANFNAVLADELAELRRLNVELRDADGTNLRLIASRFPKRCPTCSLVYKDYADFQRRCKELTSRSAIFLFETGNLYEYRNCSCGSTLVVVLECRRNVTLHGLERRRLFDRCVEKLVSTLTVPDSRLASAEVRQLFRNQIAESSSQDSAEPRA